MQMSKRRPTVAKDIMAKRLILLRPDMDLFQAIELLLKNKISGAPVVDHNDEYVGIFSEKSCLSMLVAAAYDELPTTKLDPFIDRDAPTVTEETDLLSIAQIFLNTSRRRVPVLRGRQVVGQISRRDVLRAAYKTMAVAPDTGSRILYLSSLFDANESPIG